MAFMFQIGVGTYIASMLQLLVKHMRQNFSFPTVLHIPKMSTSLCKPLSQIKLHAFARFNFLCSKGEP